MLAAIYKLWPFFSKRIRLNLAFAFVVMCIGAISDALSLIIISPVLSSIGGSDQYTKYILNYFPSLSANTAKYIFLLSFLLLLILFSAIKTYNLYLNLKVSTIIGNELIDYRGNRSIMFNASYLHQAQTISRQCYKLRTCVVFKTKDLDNVSIETIPESNQSV